MYVPERGCTTTAKCCQQATIVAESPVPECSLADILPQRKGVLPGSRAPLEPGYVGSGSSQIMLVRKDLTYAAMDWQTLGILILATAAFAPAVLITMQTWEFRRYVRS